MIFSAKCDFAAKNTSVGRSLKQVVLQFVFSSNQYGWNGYNDAKNNVGTK